MKYCCEGYEAWLTWNLMIMNNGEKKLRLYKVKLEGNEVVKSRLDFFATINYCPFCGKKLD